MSKRIPLGRMRTVESNRDGAPVLFAPIEFDSGSGNLTSAPGCAHLFEISESEDEESYEIVDVVDVVEPG
jgi:hypothetical protein